MGQNIKLKVNLKCLVIKLMIALLRNKVCYKFLLVWVWARFVNKCSNENYKWNVMTNTPILHDTFIFHNKLYFVPIHLMIIHVIYYIVCLIWLEYNSMFNMLGICFVRKCQKKDVWQLNLSHWIWTNREDLTIMLLHLFIYIYMYLRYKYGWI
jgi:hypothetical protein